MSDVAKQQDNVRFVQSVFGTVMRPNADSNFADDFVCHVAEGLPYGRDFKGPQGYLELMGQIKKFWSDIRQESTNFIPYGDDKVVIHFTLDGHIAKNGQHVRMPVVAIWELRDHKVAAITIFYYDTKRVSDLAAM
jgi:ketosteroid isomerase-like protein